MNILRKLLRISVLTGIVFNSIFLSLNGLFMIIDPKTWYEMVPGVITTGFYNQHFIRDIGIIQLFLGIAFIAGWFHPHLQLTLWGVATLWLVAHAVFHLWEVAVGICGASALLRDFAAVSLPALIGIAALLTFATK
ncbi:hypothetical protein SAMN05192566_1304 [Methylophilus rhizosphaerae]|uniref:DoxX-like family protein n=1 Tax=Methylophilus rhizosphaerae TaxID=492660 RepID=A0A1G9BRA7_9PROT|nr:hypothetical protein [Methylophilus rhizosphaerae]SDK41986.1 hypothetical protein SAMN05192566_1304 [Methylophilus rhizosphaerae]